MNLILVVVLMDFLDMYGTQTATSINSTRQYIYKVTRGSRGTYSMNKKFKLSASEVKELLAFRSDIAQFVATYQPRETFKTPVQVRWISERIKHRPTGRTYKIRRETRITSTKKYKHQRKYPKISERRQMIYCQLTRVLAEYKEERQEILTDTEKPPKKNSVCYLEAYSSFMEKCYYLHYNRNAGMNRIKDLLARACSAEWLTLSKIESAIRSCCGKRFNFKYATLP